MHTYITDIIALFALSRKSMPRKSRSSLWYFIRTAKSETTPKNITNSKKPLKIVKVKINQTFSRARDRS